MKYLSHYTENAQTELFDKTGAFFAFSEKQFKEAMTEGVKYVSCGAGLICPKQHVDELASGLSNINTKGIEADLAENGKKAIIHRELANHECQISMDISDAVDKLADYPITEEEVQAEWSEYFALCVKNDWF